MGVISSLLTLPALGPARLVRWTAKTLLEQADEELLDEGGVRGELLELQQRYDAAEIGEEEYDRLEKALLERLAAIRKSKAELGARG